MCETNLRRATCLLFALFFFGVGLGCASRADVLTRQLESKNPADRIRAIHTVADEQFDDLVPMLVNCLDDFDVAVRLYAIVALEKLTGERFGFEYAGESHLRREAIDRWRRFVADRANPTLEGAVELQDPG